MVNTIKNILFLRRNESTKENRIIQQAYNLAKKRHKGQKRLSGVPYTIHLIETATFLARWRRNYEVICAGILHDLVEDTNVPLSYIRKNFGKRVSKLVDGASWIRKMKEGKLRKDWPATYQKFVNHSKKDVDLVILKLADFKSNLPGYLHPNEEEFFRKVGSRNKAFWIPFFKEVGFVKFAKKLEKVTNKYFKEKVPITLYNYINKNELKTIKKKLGEIKYIQKELR